jgi:DNA processing protein
MNNFPELAEPIISKLNPKDKDKIFEEYQGIKDTGLTIIHPESEIYPNGYMEYVEQIGVSPIFFCKGNLSLLKANGISIVGSRNVSDTGIKITKDIAAKLTQKGQNIISGYAKGVDTASHIGALEAGGTTTLVLSYGIDEFRIKKELRNYDLAKNALLVTQFMPKEKWKARNAMTRNKLICALADGIVIIKSGPEKDAKGRMSGTFNSARNALKMDKKLFVLSPSVLEENAPGNKEILKLGGIEIFPNDITESILTHHDAPQKAKKKRMTQPKFDFKKVRPQPHQLTGSPG